MRTVCFKPGPIEPADLSDFADVLKESKEAQQPAKVKQVADSPTAALGSSADVAVETTGHDDDQYDNNRVVSPPIVAVTA